MKKLILVILTIILSISATYYITKQMNQCHCDEIKEKQILTQLEIDLIHIEMVKKNWDRY